MEALTADITEQMNNKSDVNMPSMSLGSTTAKPTETPEPEALPEEKTQGQYEQEISEADKKIEEYNQLLESLKNGDINYFKDLENKLTKEEKDELNNLIEALKDNSGIPLWMKENENNDFRTQSKDRQDKIINTYKDYYNKYYNNLLSQTRQSLYENKTSPKYDNRTDEQRRYDKLLEEQRHRDDTAYQRTVKDMAKAGLNPRTISGVNYGGGGGSSGSGSKAEEEEEKRKRRRLELLNQQNIEKQQKQRELEMITGIITGLMGTASRTVTGGMMINNMANNKVHSVTEESSYDKGYQRSYKTYNYGK